MLLCTELLLRMSVPFAPSYLDEQGHGTVPRGQNCASRFQYSMVTWPRCSQQRRCGAMPYP